MAQKTCLVVDDSRTVRKVISKIVKELGFEAIEAEDGKVALEECNKSMPSVVMLDWNMPVMDGMEFFKELIKMPNRSDTKVIFCTTENEIHKIKEAIDLGCDEYVMKPFNRSILQEKLIQVGALQ